MSKLQELREIESTMKHWARKKRTGTSKAVIKHLMTRRRKVVARIDHYLVKGA